MADFNSSSSNDEFPRARFGGTRETALRRDRTPSEASDSDSKESISGAEDGLYGVPSTFGGTHARRRRKRARTEAPVSKMTRKPNGPQEEPGGWEKHTKGIGSKLLEKMGFTGRLGARGTGITEPIQAAAREYQSAGLGKGSHREKSDAQIVEEERQAREKETAAQSTLEPLMPNWKKSGSRRLSKKVGEKVPKGPPQKERIIDMRTGEAHEVSSVTEALNETHLPSLDANTSPEPEVGQGLAVLLDTARVETQNAERARETEQLIIDNARREHKRLLAELEENQGFQTTLVKLEKEVRSLSEAATDEDFAALLEKDCAAIFEECKAQNPRFLLLDTLLQLAQPRIRACFHSAARATEGSDVASATSNAALAARILLALRTPLSVGTEEQYLRLCARTVLREARAYPLDVLNADGLAASMAAVKDALHPAVLSAFCEDILLPALEAALRRTSSRASPPPHVWIHVWLPVVGADALETLFPSIRARLARILGAWDPDSGVDTTKRAQRELRAWTGVIPRRKLHATVSRSVLPKIVAHVRRIDPNSRLECVAQIVSSWADIAPQRALADALLPALWGAVLRTRDELFARTRPESMGAICARRYCAWKDAFNGLQKYVRHVLAAYLFVLAADVRSKENAAVRGRLAGADVQYLGANAYRRERVHRPPPAAVHPRRMGVGERASLEEAVGALAQSKGLALLPDGRDRDGRAIFKIGKVRVVLDGTRQLVLRMQNANGKQVVQPVTLSRLMEVAFTG